MGSAWLRPLEEVLALLPQRRPFRFIDALTRLDQHGAEGRYRFRDDEVFYPGHFPGRPITPGAILVEAMAQVGVVAHGIYLLGLEVSPAEVPRYSTMFTEVEAEFVALVRPGDEVVARSEKLFFRRKKIRSHIELRFADGRLAATSTLSGMGVLRDDA